MGAEDQSGYIDKGLWGLDTSNGKGLGKKRKEKKRTVVTTNQYTSPPAVAKAFRRASQAINRYRYPDDLESCPAMGVGPS